MKSPASAVAVLTLLSSLAAANAADMVLKAPPVPSAPAAAPAPDWSGFYLGINGGVLIDDGYGAPLVGGTAGYNFQTGPVVLGVEGDLDAVWPYAGGTDGLGTIRGRVGLPFQWFMPYFTAGYAFSNFSTSGLAIGGGAEFRLTPTLSLKVEYLRAELDQPDDIVRLGLNWRFNLGLPVVAARD